MILNKFIKGESSAEEKKQVLLWLEEDDEHFKEYELLRRLYDWDNWNQQEASFTTRKKKATVIRRFFLEALKVAAVLCIGAFVTYFLITDKKEPEVVVKMQTVQVPSGQRVELLLSDGTKVWLNSGTTMTFPESFTRGTREITLDGEGYFKVAKAEGKPFTVHTNNYHVQVLGTEFNVKAYNKSTTFETLLLEGSVDIYSEKDAQSVRLQQNEMVSLHGNQLIKSSINNLNYLKWREGLICFEDENLESLFNKLELYYDTRIIIEKKSLLKWTYTGKFRIRDGVEHVLRVLQLKHSFSYTKNEDENTIVIK